LGSGLSKGLKKGGHKKEKTGVRKTQLPISKESLEGKPHTEGGAKKGVPEPLKGGGFLVAEKDLTLKKSPEV